jgi:sugar/nucleoside kinase (ribokinase family)
MPFWKKWKCLAVVAGLNLMAEVMCAGILVADTFCGPMDELPDEGMLLALDAMPSKAGGCAANVAICLGKQGITADVAGRLGNDPPAQIVLESLKRAGVGCEHVTFSDHQPTSQTVILLVRGQDRRYIHVFGANKEFAVAHIERAWLKGSKVFYLGGLFAMPAIQMAELLDLLRFCRSNGILTVLDVVVPKGQREFQGLYELLPYIDYFVPNDDEARQITGITDPLDQLRAFRRYGAKTVIITQGEVGCCAVKGGEIWRAGVFPVKAIDLSGSGDAFSAGLIVGILRGWEMPQVLNYASALGASATRAIGTTDGVFTASEASAFVASSSLDIRHERLD